MSYFIRLSVAAAATLAIALAGAVTTQHADNHTRLVHADEHWCC